MKLRNKGDEAFRHSDYGDVITIARTIIKDGPAPYKIRNEKGKVVSSKKEDIVAICDHFQLEVDNPMAILTQDTARKFLADSSAKEKYKFFLKGTQLDRLTENNAELESKIEYIENVLGRKSEQLPELEAEVESLEKRKEEIEQNRNLETLVNDLQAELIWSKVAALEEKRDSEIERARQSGEKLRRMRLVNTETEKQIEEGKSIVAALEKRFIIAKEDLAPLEAASNELRLKITGAKNKQRQYYNEKTDAQESIKVIESKITETRAKIDADNRKSQNDTK